MDDTNLQKFIDDVRKAILSTSPDDEFVDVEDVDSYCFALYWFMLRQSINDKQRN